MRFLQRGYFMLTLAMVVVTFALLVVFVTHIFASNTVTADDLISSSQAFYIAETGLQYGRQNLLNPNLTSRLICSTASLSTANTTIGKGTFQLTGTTEMPTALPTVTSAITTSSTSINVSNGALFTAPGRIMIDREVIDYQRISGNTLIGSSVVANTRGRDNTAISSHAIGARVGQFQCRVDSVGAVTAGTSVGQRDVANVVQLQEAWSVGANRTFWTWNNPTQNAWNSSSAAGANVQYNGVSMLNYFDGWAVGANNGNTLNVRRWDPIALSWATVAVGFNGNVSLNGVSAVSTQEAWIVGVNTGSNYMIIRWDGSTWCQLQASPSATCGGRNYLSAVPNGVRVLNSISMIDTNGDGIADVGFAAGGSTATANTLLFNGTTFTDLVAPVNMGAVYGVMIMSASEAFAVGQLSSTLPSPSNTWGGIMRWNGLTWTVVSTPDAFLRGISLIDTNADGLADYGWAVGDAGRALVYNGSTWTRQDITGGANYLGVRVLGVNDVWAVGDSGNRAHWDGSSWTVIATGGNNLKAISGVSAKISPNSGWREQAA